MNKSVREAYNQRYTDTAYHNFIKGLQGLFPGQLDFRVAETPLFIPRGFTSKIIDACEHIVDVISSPDYLSKSDAAIPPEWKVPGENQFPHCIAFDFGVCTGANGELEPQLIEMQGFPSLFCWQVLLPEEHARHLWQPEGYSIYLNGFNRDSYIDLLKRIIIADAPREEVILLEILPHQQKTRVDFYATKELLGIEVVCITELIQEGRTLYYERNGKKQKISRIYNRVIFDDLFQQPADIQEKGRIFREELDLTWVPHPNWFYRISKYSLPFIHHPYVPPTRFLNEVDQLPANLQDYVVKPLFSFAGQGVIIDVDEEAIKNIPDPENWILQKKVPYAAAIDTPDEPAKAEIRIFYFREPGKARPVAANNLARLSKGKMVGVRYNKDKTWVGGSFCLFEI